MVYYMKAFLILEDGTVFTGTSIGAKKEVISEIVFNTSMTGYLEVLTDPSYAGQAVTMTYPLIGNYGVCYEDMESKKAWPDGYIVREISRLASNFRNEAGIEEFLIKNDIPGIAGIDTRALTKILREKGTMNGMITTNEAYDLEAVKAQIKEYKVRRVVEKVTCKAVSEFQPGDLGTEVVPVKKKVAVLDLGTKNNIIRCLLKRGCSVKVFPAMSNAEDIIAMNPDGIMLTNGPGDPGVNHPVKDLESGRVYISSQNHGYVVDDTTIDPEIAKVRFINVNDKTVEGLSYLKQNVFTVQFHPEACGGPKDSELLFEEFMKMMEVSK